jgi:hypothetical protein
MRLLSHKRVLYVMLNLFQHPLPLARPASQPAPLSEAWPGSEAGGGVNYYTRRCRGEK